MFTNLGQIIGDWGSSGSNYAQDIDIDSQNKIYISGFSSRR
ncbi:unnamed protein product, partial [marine sediment metagenome]